jgi:sigma-E factor negative regulatory protein RseC
MIETQAIVIHLDGQDALVESIQGEGCGNCKKVNGCGSSNLSQLFSSEPRRFRARNNGNAKVGTLVKISLPDGALLQSALLVYFLPLALLLVGAIAGGQWVVDAMKSDAYSAIGGLTGLILGFVLVKFLSLGRRFTSHAQAAILPSSDDEIVSI